MKFKVKLVSVILLATLLTNCSKNSEDPDTAYPEIDLAFANAFPIQCAVVNKGETFTFKARFTDNRALGSFSIDVHNNFDHHSHSTEVNDCEMEPVKTPVNPFVMIRSYPIPGQVSEYEASTDIEVPENADTGDYHFLIRVTDAEGWQTIRGLSIKVR